MCVRTVNKPKHGTLEYPTEREETNHNPERKKKQRRRRCKAASPCLASPAPLGRGTLDDLANILAAAVASFAAVAVSLEPTEPGVIDTSI